MTGRRLTGGCTCGVVHYEVDDAFGYALNCHCSQCRRATGSAFKSFGGIAADRLSLVAGHDRIGARGGVRGDGRGDARGGVRGDVRGDGDDHDVFCGSCGSLVCSIVRGGAFAHVTYGTLHDAPSLRPEAHIFVGSKASWFDITDDLPRFDTLPD